MKKEEVSKLIVKKSKELRRAGSGMYWGEDYRIFVQAVNLLEYEMLEGLKNKVKK